MESRAEIAVGTSNCRSQSTENSFQITTAVEDAQDNHGLRRELKGNYGTTLETNGSQALSQFVATCAAVWKERQVVAMTLDTIDVADRAFHAVPLRDVIVEVY